MLVSMDVECVLMLVSRDMECEMCLNACVQGCGM